jgi:thiol-disulfide isomerase/thioredoxin
MSEDIRQYPVAVIAWKQDGCPVCDEFFPKFDRVAKQYEQCLPVLVADVNDYPEVADSFRVMSTPSVIISRFGQRSFRSITGDTTEADIVGLFEVAARGLDCAL